MALLSINTKKRISAFILSLLMFFSPVLNMTIHAAAETDKATLVKKSIVEASSLLETAIKKSMQESENRIKQTVAERGLDYYLTMESLHRCRNPYIDTDYIDLICAYIAAEKMKPDTAAMLYHLPFIKEKIKTTYTWEYTTVMTDEYEEVSEGSGKFRKTGQFPVDAPTTVTDFCMKKDGFYYPCGTKQIEPEKKFTAYGEIKLTGIAPEDIYELFNLDPEKCIKTAQEIKEIFLQIVNPNGLKESVFLSSRHESLLDQNIKDYIENLLSDPDLNLSRKQLIDCGASLVGLVPYEWGGKASKPGYDTSWWTIDSTGRQKGLDCSGYVQWALMSAGYEKKVYEKMISTESILKNTVSITEDDLLPGDLGLLNNGQGINHVGIYLGNGLWLHCSSGKNTVVAEKTRMFQIFKRLPAADGTENEARIHAWDIPEDAVTVKDMPPEPDGGEDSGSGYEAFDPREIEKYNSDCPFTDSEIYLAAQLVYNEANGEGLNGWAAVAEVLLNRVKSSIFPDTIKEVIYQQGQFADSDLIETREPTEDMLAVVKDVLTGNMEVLNDADVLYFRNAGGDEENWGTHAFYTTINSHQFYKQ